jgi:hypothetical protein
MARAKTRKPPRKAQHRTKARKKSASRKKPILRKKPAARKRPASKRKRVLKKKPARRAPVRRAAVRKRTVRREAVRGTTSARSTARRRRNPVEAELGPFAARPGLGPESGGQSGDIQGLSTAEVADAESVEELAEEGQAFEAELIDAVENAPEGEVRTREVPEDDVPEEYLDEEN